MQPYVICVWTVLPSTEWIRPPLPFLCSQPHHSRLHPPCPIPSSTASAASFTGGRLAGARSFGKVVPAVVFSGGRGFFVLCGDGERLIIHVDPGWRPPSDRVPEMRNQGNKMQEQEQRCVLQVPQPFPGNCSSIFCLLSVCAWIENDWIDPLL